jgi:hypothetical protein
MLEVNYGNEKHIYHVRALKLGLKPEYVIFWDEDKHM